MHACMYIYIYEHESTVKRIYGAVKTIDPTLTRTHAHTHARDAHTQGMHAPPLTKKKRHKNRNEQKKKTQRNATQRNDFFFLFFFLCFMFFVFFARRIIPTTTYTSIIPHTIQYILATLLFAAVSYPSPKTPGAEPQQSSALFSNDDVIRWRQPVSSVNGGVTGKQPPLFKTSCFQCPLFSARRYTSCGLRQVRTAVSVALAEETQRRSYQLLSEGGCYLKPNPIAEDASGS